ncbi:MAG: phosphodiester glycosidase family protein [Gemmobacter sp.]|nr:phosphodiester glycosidase family protein [Gemmobacter sp.]
MGSRAAAVVLALMLWVATSTAALAQCRDMTHDSVDYTVCEVTADQDLRLFLTAPDGSAFGTFQRIEDSLAAEGKTLAFAMNAGMYHPDRRPVGLYLENGVQNSRLITSSGPGNFGLLPNGVFCIRPNGFAVVESRTYGARQHNCRDATQSGPMLVIDGALHPRFKPDSDSRYIRNGVGVSQDGTRAVFAISGSRVTFHEFARLFRDGLGLRNALYFDGNVSRLYAPGLKRSDLGFPMGPVAGLVVAAP